MTSDWRVIEEPLAWMACDACGLARRRPSRSVDESFYRSGYSLYAHAPGSTVERGRQDEYARRELADRLEHRVPPAVRVATLRGEPEAVAGAIAARPTGAEEVGTTLREGRARAIVRFDYAHGAAVAKVLRAEIERQATSRRKPVPGRPGKGRVPLPLRARFDDPEPFEE